MELVVLKIEAIFRHEGGETETLLVLGLDEKEILLAPLFTAFEGEEGTLNLRVPREYDLEHLVKGLELPVTVQRSDLRALVLDVGDLALEAAQRWRLLRNHFVERLGQMARVHPRVEIPEFNFEVLIEGPDPVAGKIFDLSEGGMRILCDKSVHVADVVEFSLKIPGAMAWAQFANNLSWRGSVRSIHARGFGIQFEQGFEFGETIKKIVDELMAVRAQRLTYPRYNIFDYNVTGSFHATSHTENRETELEETSIRLKDISYSGTYLISEKDLPLDATLRLTIHSSDKFTNLDDRLSLSGRVARTAPDGFVVTFEPPSAEAKEKLAAWVGEVARKFGDAPKEKEPKPKQTLIIRYGSDLLFVREYLYNLSSGGLFFPGSTSVGKDDIVRFTIDLTGTSLADKLEESPAFLGRVVRTTEQGIGVQFLYPDQVRKQLEGVLGDLLRKHKEQVKDGIDLDRAAGRVAERADEESDDKTSRRGFSLPPTLHLIVWLGLLVLIMGTGVIYFGSRRQPIVLDLDGASMPAPANQEKEPIEKLATIPEEVTLVINNRFEKVRPGDIVDVTYDATQGGKAVMKDGKTLPLEMMERYLSPELRQKVGELMEATIRAQAGGY